MQILQDDSAVLMAEKIYKFFVIGQSCKVIGTVIQDGRIYEKGRKVLDELIKMDAEENTAYGKRNNRKAGPNTIGGTLAHKIFKWQRVISDDDFKYTIWRIQ